MSCRKPLCEGKRRADQGSERFGTKIITETIAKVDFSQRPFKYWTEGEEEDAEFMTADT